MSTCTPKAPKLSKHDAAINLYQVCEILKKMREISGSSEIDRLISIAFPLVKDTGDSLWPDIIEEMRASKVDPMQ